MGKCVFHLTRAKFLRLSVRRERPFSHQHVCCGTCVHCGRFWGAFLSLPSIHIWHWPGIKGLPVTLHELKECNLKHTQMLPPSWLCIAWKICCAGQGLVGHCSRNWGTCDEFPSSAGSPEHSLKKSWIYMSVPAHPHLCSFLWQTCKGFLSSGEAVPRRQTQLLYSKHNLSFAYMLTGLWLLSLCISCHGSLSLKTQVLKSFMSDIS